MRRIAAGRFAETCTLPRTKKPEGGIRIALAFPNTYYVGMSNLGFQVVYRLLNLAEETTCERVFLPDHHSRARRVGGTGQLLLSCETGRPLQSFHVIAFSISFENDFLNVLSMLSLAKIPLRQSERTAGHPLIVGGGTALFLNPEPLAEFLDVCIIGEAEQALPEFISALRDHQRGRGWKKPPLSAFASIEGVYVPSAYTVTYAPHGFIRDRTSHNGSPATVKRRWVADLDSFPATSCLISCDTEFANTALVEISRGCPRHCRFCVIGSVYKPFRTRHCSGILASLEPLLQAGHRIGILGSAVGDHPELPPLVREISARGLSASIASLRADALTAELVMALKACGHKTFTIAPEAGSERLRNAIAKDLTDADIMRAVRILAAHAVPSIKLYFMVGLPAETDQDIRAIAALTREIKHAYTQEARGTRWLRQITLSINPFIPKPMTAFQWHPFDQLTSLKQKLRVITNSLRKENKVVVTYDLPKWGYIQTLLSQGDRRVSNILLHAFEEGCDWPRALRRTSLNPDFYVYRAKDVAEILPWDFIDHGVDKRVLWGEYQSALSG